MEDKSYGDFEEVVNPDAEGQQTVPGQEGEGFVRARMPRKERGELLGVIVQRFGGNRMEVKTTDGKSRNCRVPGKYKKKLWLRPGDYVLITIWVDDDSKGDVIFKYNPTMLTQLRKKGFLDSLNNEF